MKLKTVLQAAFALATMTLACVQTTTAWAQAYPNKTIRLIVPVGPGGSPDILARSIGEKLAESLGQPVVIDNRAGANGIIAGEAVARAAPDGYTLLMAYDSHATNPSLYPLPYNTLKDFTPISMVAKIPLVMSVPPALGVNTVQEFLALAKSKPGQLNFASVGKGSSAHLASELLKTSTGSPIVHVPYKDNGSAMADLMSNRVQMVMFSVVAMVPTIKDGRMRALAVSSSQRSSALPNVPTLAEAGVAGYDYAPWIGLLGPANMPKDIVARLNAEVARIVALPDMQKRYAEQLVLTTSTPEQFAALIEGDITRWSKIVPKGE